MNWHIKEKIDKKINGKELYQVIEQIFLQRGIKTAEDVDKFLSPDYEKDLHDPFLFNDMEKVVQRVYEAVSIGERVGIFGDHDADGVSSATVLAEGLEALGLDVEVYIPDKITEGHGINATAIDLFKKEKVSLLFSVDCGTSNVNEVAYAVSCGMDVIITDHHHAPEVLPNAYAIINPQVIGEKYPFKELSGTAVAFKVVQALHSIFLPEEMDKLKWMLDVVCVGTVADCMPLVGENRVFVKYGLIVLSKTRRKGYQELIKTGNLAITEQKVPSVHMVAFQIAPRINAAGRMTHAKHAYALMREQKYENARKLSQDIEQQNIQRRQLVDKITHEAEKIVEEEQRDRSFIVIASEEYPVGIVGIVAGRIAEKYQKPTGVFSKIGDEGRGSFRSVDGVHIVDVLTACSMHLNKYGGHEKAAGATIDNKKLDDFAQAADAYVKELSIDLSAEPVLWADGEIELSEVNHELLYFLQKCEPFGEGNEEPVFCIRDVIVDSVRMVGNGDEHIKLRVSSRDEQYAVDGIGFGLGKKCSEIVVGDVITVYAHIQENEWMGNVSVQLNIIDIV
ncbi:MAG: single-stranded-DNA-specific exonuclease RecJ [Candidatus Moraniibacteriota bacterium]|nr:MAG: single-stranded-DNA-specific exonuclease RecJ [Candidatus Moranbacteria bacterium]